MTRLNRSSRWLFVVAVVLLAPCSARAQTMVQPPEGVVSEGVIVEGEAGPYVSSEEMVGDGRSASRLWASAEMLLNWQSCPHLPVLVTSSPSGTPFGKAGVLGNATTSVVFGGSHLDQGVFPGVNFTLGALLPSSDTLGVEVGGFVFGKVTTTSSNASNAAGNPAIGVPFLGAVSGQQAASLVAFPGVFAGGVDVAYSSQMFGSEANFVLLANDDRDFRLTALAGFRYLDFQESLNITQSTTVLGGGAILFNGNTAVLAPNGVQINDSFNTRNQFCGGQIGVRAGRDFGMFSVDVTGKLALGDMLEIVKTEGTSSLVAPGATPATVGGGLFAVSTNTGTQRKNFCVVIPEFELRIGVQVTSNLNLFIGGNFLYVSSVARPGDQIDTAVNVAKVPTSFAFGAPGGPASPARLLQQTSLWDGGLNLGLRFTY
jgi:hypothetical protein